MRGVDVRRQAQVERRQAGTMGVLCSTIKAIRQRTVFLLLGPLPFY